MNWMEYVLAAVGIVCAALAFFMLYCAVNSTEMREKLYYKCIQDGRKDYECYSYVAGRR